MMKTRFIHIAFVLGFSLLLNGVMMTYGQNQFKTQKEAIQNAQQDLVKILESDIKIDIDVRAEQIKEAKPMEAVSFLQVDFDALIDTDSAFSFNQLSSEIVYYIAPLSAKSKVVTVVKVNQQDNSWKVSGMGDKMITDDLNNLPPETFDNGFKHLKIFEVPNIQAIVYVVDLRAEEVAYTDYGNFSIKEKEDPAILIEVLKNDAVFFHAKWGEQLKKGKLLK